MRAEPPLEIEILRFGAWKGGTLALLAAVCATLALWWRSHPAPAPAWVAAVAALGMLGAAAAALPSFRSRRLTLRRSAGQWQLAFTHGVSAPAMAGELLVALDLGAWMLLRFVAGAPGGHARWIPIQRHGLEPHWHALRCAVYGPRPRRPADAVTADV